MKQCFGCQSSNLRIERELCWECKENLKANEIEEILMACTFWLDDFSLTYHLVLTGRRATMYAVDVAPTDRVCAAAGHGNDDDTKSQEIQALRIGPSSTKPCKFDASGTIRRLCDWSRPE